jgi:hypothetical protein
VIKRLQHLCEGDATKSNGTLQKNRNIPFFNLIKTLS